MVKVISPFMLSKFSAEGFAIGDGSGMRAGVDLGVCEGVASRDLWTYGVVGDGLKEANDLDEFSGLISGVCPA
jgi:hypothetical protein